MEPLFGDPEPRPVPDQEAAAEPGAEHEADRVAEEGGKPGDPEDQRKRDVALAGDCAAEQHRELAGGDQADESPGLEEGEDADQEVGPRAETPGEITR